MTRTALSLSLSAALLLGAAGVARAGVAYSYEVENADHPRGDRVLVVWPRACSATGEPLGKIDLALNPDWASRMHDVDYEVVVGGNHHTLLAPCAKTARLYALPVDAFARGSRVSTADDMSIGQLEAGKPFVILPALDAVELPKRMVFFATDPRVLRSTFRFEPEKASRPPGLKAVHEVLVVDAFDTTTLKVEVKRAVYTYLDGHTETATEPSAASPAPSSAADPGPPAAATTASQEEPVKKDLGTRWVVLAAVAGLFVGGVMAWRKKRDAPK